MEIKLPRLFPYQAAAIKSKSVISMILGSRRSGKTVSLLHLYVKALKGKHIALIMPNFPNSLRRRDELVRIFSSVANSKFSAKVLQFVGDGSVSVFSGESLDEVRGSSFDLVLIDEAQSFQYLSDVIKASMPTLVDRKGQMFLIGSYITKSSFVEMFEAVNYNINKFVFRVQDNPTVDQNYLLQQKQVMALEDFLEEYEMIPKLNTQYNFFRWNGNLESEMPSLGNMLYTSWDFNVMNCNIVVAWRHGKTLHVIDHIEAMSIEDGCRTLREKYELVKRGAIYVCGDASGLSRNVMSNYTYYTEIQRLLNLGGTSWNKVSLKGNPFHHESREFVNAVIREFDIRIPARLTVLTQSIFGLAYDPNTNAIDKTKNLDHSTDAFRYLLHGAFDIKEVFKPITDPKEFKPRDYALQPIRPKEFWIRDKDTNQVVGLKYI